MVSIRDKIDCYTIGSIPEVGVQQEYFQVPHDLGFDFHDWRVLQKPWLASNSIVTNSLSEPNPEQELVF